MAEKTVLICDACGQPAVVTAKVEGWVGTVRAECLDWTLILGRHHLERVLRTYIRHYNEARPHRGLALLTPIARSPTPSADLWAADLRRRDVLGGLIHEYSVAA